MSKRRTVPDTFKQVGDILQGWDRGLELFRCNEVLVWNHDGSIGIAFRGDALRIELGVFQHLMFNNRDHWLDFDMQRQFFGDEVTLRRDTPTRHLTILGGLGQSMDEPDVHFSDVLSSVASAVGEHLLRQSSEYDVAVAAMRGRPEEPPPVHVTLMPNEGSPWEPGDRVTPYYNAKTKLVEETPKPDWLIEVEARDEESGKYEKAVGADFCKISSTIHAEPGGPIMVRDPAKSLNLMMTHGFDFFRANFDWRGMAKLINRCGGLLFPSIAVGQVPATTIGSTIFVLDAHVVLQGIKPYRTGRGRWPIVTYASDAWTETTGAFLGEAARQVFLQLTGQWEPSIYGTPHFYVLGPRIGSQWGDLEGADAIIGDTKKLSSTMARRARKWHREADGNDLGELRSDITIDRYPYLEAKANGIVAVDALALCVVSSAFSRQVGSLLRAINFGGDVLTLKVTAAEAKALEVGTDYDYLFQYSWRVHDAVAEYAASSGRVEILRF